MAHPDGVLHNDGPDEEDCLVRKSLHRYDRTKELLLFLHGDGVLGKLVHKGLCKGIRSITGDESHVISSAKLIYVYLKMMLSYLL